MSASSKDIGSFRDIDVQSSPELAEAIEIQEERFFIAYALAMSNHKDRETGGYTMRIAFAGNPNSGKTTMYNALTGRNEKVGNWAGVTVDKKEALIKKAFVGDRELVAVDLPGAYSSAGLRL